MGGLPCHVVPYNRLTHSGSWAAGHCTTTGGGGKVVGAPGFGSPAPAPHPPAPRGPGHSPHCAHLLTSCDMCVRVHTVLVWDCPPPPHTHTRTHTAHRMSSTPVPSAPRKGAGRSCSRSPPGRSGVGPARKPSTVTTMRNRTWSPSSRRGWTGGLAPTTCSAPGQPPPRGPAARPEVGQSSHGVGVRASGPCRPQPPAKAPDRWRCTGPPPQLFAPPPHTHAHTYIHATRRETGHS